MKLKLKDGTEFPVLSGILPGSVTVTLEDYAELEKLDQALSVPGNLDAVMLGEEKIENLGLLAEMYFSAGRKDGKIQATFMLRQKTEEEIAIEAAETEIRNQQENIDTALTYLTDQQALTVKTLHKRWEDDPDGYSYRMDNPEDRRRQYEDGLWNLQKDHEKQASWYPGADPTLWVQIVPEHAGTREDPIPVPDSVTTSGFVYVYGNYYSEGDQVYLCQRQGVPNPEEMYGEEEKLYAFPSALTGQYFIIAE